MANTAKWSVGGATFAAPSNLLTTELNSLANNTGVISSVTNSGIYDNSVNLDLYAALLFHLVSVTTVAPAYCNVYILTSTDGGTTFPAGTLSNLQAQATQLWASIPMFGGAVAQDIWIPNLILPAAKFKVFFENQSGVAFAASGNTLKIATYNVNLNG